LLEVFRDVLERQKAITEIQIARDEMTIAEKIAEIKLGLTRHEELRARQLFEGAKSRREMVLIFLALLELVKELVVRLRQAETFGDILIVRRPVEDLLEAIPTPSAEAPPVEGAQTTNLVAVERDPAEEQ
jgi:segregation and condensation protein A